MIFVNTSMIIGIWSDHIRRFCVNILLLTWNIIRNRYLQSLPQMKGILVRQTEESQTVCRVKYKAHGFLAAQQTKYPSLAFIYNLYLSYNLFVYNFYNLTFHFSFTALRTRWSSLPFTHCTKWLDQSFFSNYWSNNCFAFKKIHWVIMHLVLVNIVKFLRLINNLSE